MKAKGLFITLLVLVFFFITPMLINPGHKSLSVCPSKLFFGVRCPVCGMGRAFSNIGRGEFSKAFYYNKSAFVFFVVLIFAIYLVFINFIFHNTGKKLPGFKLISLVNKHVVLITFFLLFILLAAYLFDFLTGKGEPFFNKKYTLWHWLGK